MCGKPERKRGSEGSWTDANTTAGLTTQERPGGKAEEQERLQEGRMNDEQTSGELEAEAAICLPAELRITRLLSGTGERRSTAPSCLPSILLWASLISRVFFISDTCTHSTCLICYSFFFFSSFRHQTSKKAFYSPP